MLLFAGKASAVEAYPHKIKYPQPDGKTIVTLTMRGDERVSWAETEDGYTLVYNSQGYFVYATLDQRGDLVPSQYIATEITARSAEVSDFLARTPKYLRYSRSQINDMLSIWNIRENKAKALEKSSNTTDTVRILVIMMQYPNRSFARTQQEINNLFNQVNYSAGNARGSVHDYYNEVSYGKLKLVADVVGPYTCDYNSRHYGKHGQGSAAQGSEFATEAMRKAVAGGADFSRYDSDGDGAVDCVHIIFAGFGQESGGGDSVIWSHKWSASQRVVNNGKYAQVYSCSPELSGNAGNNTTNKMSHIGVPCHEIGHVLGAPDFYDIDYADNGQYPGMGNWDIMAGGSWNGTPHEGGNSPAHHNAYTKAYIYHWVNPVVLTGYDTVTLQPVKSDSNSFYRINTATPNEFYLIDNRQKLGYDTAIPGHGLMFYHVHSSLNPLSNIGANYTHPMKLYPVCATASAPIPYDSASYGDINSANCPFPGHGNRTSFTDYTTPRTWSWAGENSYMPIQQITENTTNHTVTFIYGYPTNPNCNAPTNVRVDAITDDYVELSWTNNSSATVWEIQYCRSGLDPSVASNMRKIRNITNTSYRINNLPVNDTIYDFYVRSICGVGDTSAWSLIKASSLIKMPSSGRDSIKACGIHIYDNGGPNTDYLENNNSILVVKAAHPKAKVNINGILNREDFDEVYIFDGEDTSGTLINHYYNASPSGAFVNDSVNDTSVSGALTILFVSDPYLAGTGFDFLVTCIDTADCSEQPVPYTEDFHNYESSNATAAGGNIPRCWTTYTSNTSASTAAGFQPHVCATSNYSPYASQSNKYLVMAVKRETSSQRAYSILPGFDDTITKCKISFKVRMGGSTVSANTEKLQLGYVANYTGAKATDTVFTPLTTIAICTTANGANNQKVVSLNNYNIPDTARLAFRWMTTRSSGSSTYYCGIDDINVTSCEGSSQQDVFTCNPTYTWTLNGETYSSDTVVMHRISGASSTGCDSLVYLNLTFRHPTSATDTIRACRSYTWINDTTYTTSNYTAVHHLTNTMGCDSTVYLHLTIQNDTHVIDNVVACGSSYTWIDSVTYTSNTTTPTYNYTTSTGCDSTIHLHLTFATATYGVDTVIACDSITWINGTTYRASTSIPRCTIVNAMGCDSIVQLRLTIKHKPTNLQVSADRTTIDAGDSVTLTASGAVSYLWSTGSTNNPIVEFPRTTTEYSVIGINANSPDCMDTASVIITVNAGINNADAFRLNVYPNPAQHFITVDGDNLSQILIYNSVGQCVAKQTAINGKNNISIEELADGIYTLQVLNTAGKKSVRTFVIHRN